MFTRISGKGHDERRLRVLLVVLFLALAVPTSAVLWQAYGQLKWESFHQYRTQAEELSERINASLSDAIAQAESRSFASYAFLNVSGDPQAGFLQRSPLSALPVTQDVPGVIGHFQVDADGRFSSPLLPDQYQNLPSLGLSSGELEQRARLAAQLQSLLLENKLVEARETDLLNVDEVLTGDQRQTPVQEEEQAAARTPRPGTGGEVTRALAREDDQAREGAQAEAGNEPGDTTRMQAEASIADAEPVGAAGVELGDSVEQSKGPGSRAYEESALALKNNNAPPAKTKQYGSVQELKLDDALQKKSERFEDETEEAPRSSGPAEQASQDGYRMRRVEQSVLPESLDAAPSLEAGADADLAAGTGTLSANETRAASAPVAAQNLPLQPEVLIRTFESQVEPLQFAAFESGELVLYRRVWRDEARYVQGMIIDRDRFLENVIMAPFRATTLSAMSDLVVALEDDVIGLARAASDATYLEDVSGMEGDLLYRSRLSSPLDPVELIYSVRRLPAGPGGQVLGWTTILLIAVFGGGFFALYRLGMGQIRLARQQQDFVSSVSHELKTPLTSIRMYSEMLREGWADEHRQQQYYAFIHDESERLSRLIANVLQLASITRNEPTLELKTIRVDRLLDGIRSKIATQVERAGFEAEFSVDDETAGAWIEVDEDCMSQILINLVDNALKFSRNAEPRRIEIGAALTRERSVRITVRDHGPGIPREQMKKIFRLFYRPESELTRETVGTGIGLAIVHQLTQAMGGSVDVLNRSPGAEFGITIPVVTAP